MSLVYGVVPAWTSLLPILLRPLSIPQITTGFIGVFAQVTTVVGSLIAGSYVKCIKSSNYINLIIVYL